MLVVISNFFFMFCLSGSDDYFSLKTRRCPLSHFLTILFGAKPAAASLSRCYIILYYFIYYYHRIAVYVNHANALLIGQ